MAFKSIVTLVQNFPHFAQSAPLASKSTLHLTIKIRTLTNLACEILTNKNMSKNPTPSYVPTLAQS